MAGFVAACVLGIAAPALAGVITPTSYDMLNGDTGSFTYFDDTYNGSGSTTTPGAALSGGVGDLTDGVIATQNWFSTPGPYVGWELYDPTITFHFGSVVSITKVTVYVDDSNGSGGVFTPASVDIAMGATTQSFSVTDPAGGAPLTLVFNTSLSGSSLDLTLHRFASQYSWVFASEVQFEGTTGVAVPLPSSAWAGLSGFGALALVSLRRRAKRRTS